MGTYYMTILVDKVNAYPSDVKSDIIVDGHDGRYRVVKWKRGKPVAFETITPQTEIP